MIKELNINELESIIGGGNVSNCLLSASGAFATIAGAGAVAGCPWLVKDVRERERELVIRREDGETKAIELELDWVMTDKIRNQLLSKLLVIMPH